MQEIEAFFQSKADEVDAFVARRKEERDTRLRLEAEARARAERAATEKRRLEEVCRCCTFLVHGRCKFTTCLLSTAPRLLAH